MRPMRRITALVACVVAIAVVVVAASAAVVARGQFRASLSAASHTPTVNARWAYVVSARTLSGRPLKASAHLQVFENGRRVDIVGWRQFKGTLRGTKRWAPSTRGHRYVFQALLIATGANGHKSTLKLNYAVSPR
jgi:hypothetical protein